MRQDKELYKMVSKTGYFILSLFLLASCFNSDIAMNTYKWTASESAETNYPMHLIKGDLELSDQTNFYIPDKRLVRSGWGSGGSHHIVGAEYKALPRSTSLEWFSYREDKFYATDFDLPIDKIEQLFKLGYKRENDNKLKNFNKIIFGIGLGGNVSIWVTGNDFTVEASRFSAQKTTGDWRHIIKNPKIVREEFVKKIVSQSTSENDRYQINTEASNELWRKYQYQYSWEPIVLGNVKPLDIFIHYYNGEKGFTNTILGDDSKYYFRSIPRKMYIDYEVIGTGKKYNSEIYFSDEIVRAFEKLHAENPKEKLRLQIEVHAASRTIAVYLQSSQFTMRLKEVKVETGAYPS